MDAASPAPNRIHDVRKISVLVKKVQKCPVFSICPLTPISRCWVYCIKKRIEYTSRFHLTSQLDIALLERLVRALGKSINAYNITVRGWNRSEGF